VWKGMQGWIRPPGTYDYITFGPVTLRTSAPSDQWPVPLHSTNCAKFVSYFGWAVNSTTSWQTVGNPAGSICLFSALVCVYVCANYYGCVVPVNSRYTYSIQYVMLIANMRTKVVQGHWKWHHLIDRVRVPILLPFQLWLCLVPFWK